MKNVELPQNELENLLDAHREWLLIDAAGKSLALRKTEIEISRERGRTLIGFLDDKGFQTWRVAGLKFKGGEITLNLTRNFERERAKIRLVPRARAKDLRDAVELARLERANKIAHLIAAQYPRTRLVRVELNRDSGRFAQIVFEDERKKHIAALSDVSDSLTPEILLSTAVLRLDRLQRRRKNPIDALWIAAEKKQARKLRKMHALLHEKWKAKIFIREISRAGAENQNAEMLKVVPPLGVVDLWRGRARELKLAENAQLSAAAQEIIALAPGEIDAVFTRRGETLRYNGLPFARVRRVFGREKVWFGIERERAPLAEVNSDEFSRLLEDLRRFRRASAPDRRHAFYRSAPEAWLEAILRRNIRLLDANLVLSPLYHQFRADREKIDLLALRRDGRLVIIEVKTAPDREMIFQAADYWRRIEFLRRRGSLQSARLFGDLAISDRPAICYLVAPTLSFHRDFDFLARAIAPEVELHRFNLAENWRAGLRVLDRRKTVSD